MAPPCPANLLADGIDEFQVANFCAYVQNTLVPALQALGGLSPCSSLIDGLTSANIGFYPAEWGGPQADGMVWHGSYSRDYDQILLNGELWIDVDITVLHEAAHRADPNIIDDDAESLAQYCINQIA